MTTTVNDNDISAVLPDNIFSSSNSDHNIIELGGGEPKFSSYDILLLSSRGEADDHDDNRASIRFAPGYVGNHRFIVLLSLYRPRYHDAEKRGDANGCIRIASELVDVVCSKCIPNGRFFEQQKDDNNGRGQWRELRSCPISLVQCMLKDTRQFVMPSKPKLLRRRRSSIVSNDSEYSMPNRFDVICEEKGQHLKKGSEHTGNNRLKVMLNMRMSTYSKANPTGKHRIIEEIVTSIMVDASSVFLRVTEERFGVRYLPMSRELAMECISNTLEIMSEDEKTQYRHREVQMLMARKKKKDALGKCVERMKESSYDCSQPSSVPTTLKHSPYYVISRAA